MKVILLERVAKLGHMGEEVKVKDGYARNFLLPLGKALRANAANRARFEADREIIEEKNKERMSSAQEVGDALDGKSFVVIRSAGETGQLYGSVASRDVISILAENGFKVQRSQVDLNTPIKTLGLHTITLNLHADVVISVEFNIGRTADEAELQAQGIDMSSADAMYDLAEKAEAEEASEGEAVEGEEGVAEESSDEAAADDASEEDEA
ncbi:50S ribosomal protein L9 [Lentilitoribacter sp. EG35]|uniref:50S ribosomal protein L9 n=1 Tax=Lentilitoribacter sp. EG35 TaxID=3234192 RepID=UPI003460C0BD